MKNVWGSMVALLLCSSIVQGQACCGTGSSQTTSGFPPLEKGMASFKTGLTYSQAPGNEMQTGGIILSASYGFTDNFLVFINTNYSLNHSSLFREGRYDTVIIGVDTLIETIKSDTTFNFKNHGFGDGSFGSQYVLVPWNAFTKQILKVGVQVGIPWGKSGIKNDIDGKFTDIPDKAQIGKSNFSIGGFVSYGKSFPSDKFTATAALSSNLPFKQKNGKKAGNEMSSTISGIFGPYAMFTIVVSLHYSVLSSALDEKGEKIQGSKGKRLDLLPAIEITANENVSFALNVGFPLVRDMNQEAVGTNFAIQFLSIVTFPMVSVTEEELNHIGG